MLLYDDLTELQKLIIDAWIEEGMTAENALRQLQQDLLVAEEEGIESILDPALAPSPGR